MAFPDNCLVTELEDKRYETLACCTAQIRHWPTPSNARVTAQTHEYTSRQTLEEAQYLVRQRGGLVARSRTGTKRSMVSVRNEVWLFATHLDECGEIFGLAEPPITGQILRLSEDKALLVTSTRNYRFTAIAESTAASAQPISNATTSESSLEGYQNSKITNFEVRNMFCEAIHGLVGLRLASSEGLTSFHSNILSVRDPNCNEISYIPFGLHREISALINVGIGVQPAGRVSISQRCFRLEEASSAPLFFRLSNSNILNDVVILLPGTSMGRTISFDASSFNGRVLSDIESQQGEKLNEIFHWRSLVSRWLHYRGISLANLSQEHAWQRLQILEFSDDERSTTSPTDSIIDWPKALCLSIKDMRVKSLLANEDSISVRENVVELRDTKDQAVDLAEFAISWARDKFALDDIAASPEKATGEQQTVPYNQEDEDDSMDLDTGWLNISPSNRPDSQNMNQDLAGIYPTPPDVNSIHITPASTAADAQNFSLAVDPDREAKTFAEPGHETNLGLPGHEERRQSTRDHTPLRGNSIPDFMYDAGEDDVLAQEHITDADFNFFDDPDTFSKSNSDVVHVEDGVERTIEPLIQTTPDIRNIPRVESPANTPQGASGSKTYDSPRTIADQSTDQVPSDISPIAATRTGPTESRRKSSNSNVFRSLEVADQKYQASGRFFTTSANSSPTKDITRPLGRNNSSTSNKLIVSPSKALNSVPRLDGIRASVESDSSSSDNDNTDDSDLTYIDKTEPHRNMRQSISSIPANNVQYIPHRPNQTMASTSNGSELRKSHFEHSAEAVLSEILDAPRELSEEPGVISFKLGRERDRFTYSVNNFTPLVVDEFISVAQVVTEQLGTFPLQNSNERRPPTAICAANQSVLSRHILDRITNIFTKAEVVRLETLLAPRSYTDETGENPLCAFAPPEILLRRSDVPYTVLPSILPFWETMGLEPAHGRKDVASYCLYSSPTVSLGQARAFLHGMQRAYESHKFGSHRVDSSTDSTVNGLHPYIALEHGSAALDTSILQKAFTTIGNECSRIKIQTSVVVIYVASKLASTSLRKICTCFWKFVSSQKSSSKSYPTLRYLLQIIPSDDEWFHGDLSTRGPEFFARVAHSIYDRVPGATPKDDNSSFSRSRAVELANDIPSRISFRFVESAPRYLMAETAFAHVAYSRSLDGRWITAAWTDNYGKRDALRSYCLNDSQDLKDVIQEIWATTLAYIGFLQTSWQVFIAKVGYMGKEEVSAWKATQADLSSSVPFSVNLVLLAVDPVPTLSLLPEAPSTGVISLPTSAHATPQPTTYPTNYATPPMSTPPQFPISSPAAVASTPTAEAGGAPVDLDPNARLIDITDESWGLIAREPRILHPCGGEDAEKQRLVTGYLVKRGGPDDLDETILMEVTLLCLIEEDGYGSSTKTEGPRKPTVELMNLLRMYRDLSLLARIRGTTHKIKGLLPWHIAVSVTTVDILSKEMPLHIVQE